VTAAAPLVHANPQTPQVGTYVYTWYDPDEPVSWEYPKITDKPVQGYYNSCDPGVIATQLKQIEDLGVDYVMLSWLGPDTFSDRTVGEWYQVAYENCTRLKLAVMVEPFNETGEYNYTAIYERAYELYDAYEAVQFLQKDEYGNLAPVIFFYNSGVLTGETGVDFPRFPNDPRFVELTVGHRSYVDFWYDDVHQDLVAPWTPWGRQISVVPRFDDYWQWKMGLRDHTDTVDRDLSEGLYAGQWERALNFSELGMVDFVNIVTWNEYPERTAIEPHYDNTAWNTDPYYLYNLTRDYILELKGLDEVAYDPPRYWYQNPYSFVAIAAVAAICILVCIEIYKHY
jgi:hypothetical protein